MKVIIENTMPMNNGDAALVFAVGDQLKDCGFIVEYSTTRFDIAKEKYPNEKWIKSAISSKFVRLPFIGYIYIFIQLLFSTSYRDADAIISAPGGYIHEYYRFQLQLKVLSMCNKVLGKKIFMYSQSIGKLSESNQSFLREQVEKYKLFYVRDQISFDRVSALGLFNNVYQTKDAAFLLKPIKGKKRPRTVAISVREWSFENRDEQHYIALISGIVECLLDRHYSITFLSTCQGDDRYKDDSKMANKVIGTMPDEWKDNITLDQSYYTLKQLRMKLTEYEIVVGTRLHMCILSWLSGTPALNITYEEKGKECYAYLGIPQYSVDYNEVNDVRSDVESFINSSHNDVYKRIKNIREENLYYLHKMINSIN